MASDTTTAGWIGGLAEWVEGDTAHLSVAFTWLLNDARDRALWYKALGYKVRAGGPALFRPRGYLDGFAELGGEIPDALRHHNPQATIASRGCPVGCWFCIVPAMEGRAFTLLPDFPVRPILCDNNLSALPVEYQRHIIERYKAEGVPLLDANSGFEPRSFDEGVYARWREINRGPWRFAFDDWDESRDVFRTLRMLEHLPGKKKRVYVLIGNEPFVDCMARLAFVIYGPHGDFSRPIARPYAEPHVQPLMKLNALEKEHWIRHDWTPELLRDVARWANRRIYRYASWNEYAGSVKSSEAGRYDSQQELFI